MSPSDSDEHDPPFCSHREKTRAVLRHLIFERRLNPCHPLVASYDHHLYLSTAQEEYDRARELSSPGLDLVALRTVCYRGADLSFRYCDRVATSIYQESDEEPRNHGWENGREESGKTLDEESRKSCEGEITPWNERPGEGWEERNPGSEGNRKSWEGKSPGGEGKRRSWEEKSPGSEGNRRSWEGKSPGSEGKRRSWEKERNNCDNNW